jgi:integrase
VNTIISALKKRYSTIFSILRDTGLRPIELHRLLLKNIDLEKGIIYPQTAKSRTGRILKLTTPLPRRRREIGDLSKYAA